MTLEVYKRGYGGPDWTRTNDHYHVKVVLYQLSYGTEKRNGIIAG